MTAKNFVLKNNRENISYDELIALMSDYYSCRQDNPVRQWPEGSKIPDAIAFLKRDNKKQIGPYINLSLFEALNRVASDLVIMHGLKGLIEQVPEHKDAKMTIYFGNEDSAHGDFEIGGKHGEAFNVAPSFFDGKMRQTKTKWMGNGKDKIAKQEQLHYIFYNGELGEIKKIDKYLNTLPANFYANVLVGVNSWNKGLEGAESINIKKL
jgi:hypothetical protein